MNHQITISAASRATLQQLALRSPFAKLPAQLNQNLKALQPKKRSLKDLSELEILRLQNEDHFLTKRLHSHFVFLVQEFIKAELRKSIAAIEQIENDKHQKFTLKDLLLDTHTVRANAPNAAAAFTAAALVTR